MASGAEAVPDAENLSRNVCLCIMTPSFSVTCSHADDKAHTRVHGLFSIPIHLFQFRNVIPTLEI